MFPFDKYNTPEGFKTKEELENERLEAKYGAYHVLCIAGILTGAAIATLFGYLGMEIGLFAGLALFSVAFFILFLVHRMEAHERNDLFLTDLYYGTEIRIKMVWHALVGPRK